MFMFSIVILYHHTINNDIIQGIIFEAPGF